MDQSGDTPTTTTPSGGQNDGGQERHAVPDATEQQGNAASTSPGGGEMSVAPLTADNRNTNLDRDRREAARILGPIVDSE